MIRISNIHDGIVGLMGTRTIQVIIISITSMLLCQIVKFIIFSVKDKKMVWAALFTTGGMPSSHTSCVTSLVISLGFLQLHDLGYLDYSFAIALIFAMIIIHDAMGVRLEASKHAKILNHMMKDESLEERKNIGFGEKGFLKELLGHKGIEVIGGLIFGILVAVIGCLIIVI